MSIHRRDFLALSGSAVCALVSASARSQPTNSLVRGAVVIGVDKAGSLPKLSAAAAGARNLGTWLEGEGFEVKLLVDDDKPVVFDDVYNAIEELVNRGTLDQLVIYFAGHGFLNNYAEYWLLSKAPDNPNQALSLVESMARAKRTGIPNVIFISDACRSTPDSLKTSNVRGGMVFPTTSSNSHVDVDRFLAALPGDPALELPVSESVPIFEGIFTTCFLEAFRHPDPEMVATLQDGTRVVPNRMLGGYLVQKVQQRAQARSIKLKQVPDWDVVSGERAYIGRVAPEPTASASRIDPGATVVDVARTVLAQVSVDALKEYRAPANTMSLPREGDHVEQIARVGNESGFFTNQAAILKAQAPSRFESLHTGFVVRGAELELALDEDGRRIDPLKLEESPGATEIGVDLKERPAASVALRFADGMGCVVAALSEFIGNVVVDEQGVSNISYVPSKYNYRRAHYESQRARLDELHAAVATSARFGVFRIAGDRHSREQNAKQLADRIRTLKGIDPTLGLYAAYAYANSDLTESVRSVRELMRSDLGTDLFDLALLARGLSNQIVVAEPSPPTVPLCPMLSQGWELLRVNDVPLPIELEEARPYLRPSLWTTFDGKGMDSVLRLFTRRR